MLFHKSLSKPYYVLPLNNSHFQAKTYFYPDKSVLQYG